MAKVEHPLRVNKCQFVLLSGEFGSEGIAQNIRMIKLHKDVRQKAVASIERYFLQNMEEKIGNVAAAGLLGFFLEEIAPAVYNQAVHDVQGRLRLRVDEIDLEVHEDEFTYWNTSEKGSKRC